MLVYSQEPRVLDRDRNMRAELPQQRLVGFRELTGGVAQQVERADDAALPPQRHDQLRLRPGYGLQVSRVGVDVVHQYRFAFSHGGAHQALADLDAQRARDVIGIADGVRDRQPFAPRIEEVDRKRLEFRDPRDEERDLVEQLVEIEHGCDLATELEERDHELSNARRREGSLGGFAHKV